MNLSKVKLVVSDMDGTLLNSKGEVSDLFFDLFQQLKNKNIHFCAASGRQYNSIVHKLAPIKDDIFVIAENGGIAKKKDNLLVLNALSPVKIKKIIPVLRTINNAHVVLCGKNGAFIESKNQEFINLFQEYYHTYEIVDDLTAIADTEDFLKIAIYHFTSSEEYIYPTVKEFESEMLIKISGKNWLDISDEKANKGNALREVQGLLKVTKEETMVFGDYHNDIEMLKEANFSFSMKNAHKDITKLANYSTESNDNLGVEKILNLLIKSNSNL
ncbi:Cof-type HAD-IIB family hydrolase [Polaribacter sp. Hel1_85]|uniref:Cof-type HAD-IIB family hydrolase n=1 Tax=Polaribacter sp. Hel1_85 TaxID=1250005 RepID=UPI00052C3DD6|nr:Cof-type HAD-IIB family hydrolase [Polaribacter sp. Hel1_85]KGL58596.1 haloacid dehalogenase-like hydrolase [Polaribacter sp. Hel1_85]